MYIMVLIDCFVLRLKLRTFLPFQVVIFVLCQRNLQLFRAHGFLWPCGLFSERVQNSYLG